MAGVYLTIKSDVQIGKRDRFRRLYDNGSTCFKHTNRLRNRVSTFLS